MTSKTLLQRLQAIRQDIDVMPKDGHNDFNHYDYLSEAQVTAKMKELMDKHGVIFAQSNRIIGVREQGQTKSGNSNFMTTVKVLYKFVNVDDPADELKGFGYGQGTDTGDKGVYKAITGAIKYIFMKNFLIPTGDDAEKHSPSSRPYKPTTEIKYEAVNSEGCTEDHDKLPILTVQKESKNKGRKFQSCQKCGMFRWVPNDVH